MAERYWIEDLTAHQARVLWLMCKRIDKPWNRLSLWLLNVGRHNVPETRDSRNPIKWAMAEVGLWMTDREIARCHRDTEEADRGR